MEHLDLSMISSLMDATLSSLDKAMVPAANWMLELRNDTRELETVTGQGITAMELSLLQERVGKPFIALLNDIVGPVFFLRCCGSFSISDPKVPATDSPLFSSYGQD